MSVIETDHVSKLLNCELQNCVNRWIDSIKRQDSVIQLVEQGYKSAIRSVMYQLNIEEKDIDYSQIPEGQR